jgi:hypothetical protein
MTTSRAEQTESRADVLAQVQAAIIKELGRANREADHAQRIAAAPYSGHERMADLHRARGIQQGLGMALDIFDEVVRRGI